MNCIQPVARLRQFVTGAGCVLLLSGCATAPPPPASLKPAETAVLVPVTEGRITLVNPELKFVVVDFSGANIPAAGTTVDVYREDQLIGQVRVTEPMRGPFTAADIVKGDPQLGDRVR